MSDTKQQLHDEEVAELEKFKRRFVITELYELDRIKGVAGRLCGFKIFDSLKPELAGFISLEFIPTELMEWLRDNATYIQHEGCHRQVKGATIPMDRAGKISLTQCEETCPVCGAKLYANSLELMDSARQDHHTSGDCDRMSKRARKPIGDALGNLGLKLMRALATEQYTVQHVKTTSSQIRPGQFLERKKVTFERVLDETEAGTTLEEHVVASPSEFRALAAEQKLEELSLAVHQFLNEHQLGMELPPGQPLLERLIAATQDLRGLPRRRFRLAIVTERGRAAIAQSSHADLLSGEHKLVVPSDLEEIEPTKYDELGARKVSSRSESGIGFDPDTVPKGPSSGI